MLDKQQPIENKAQLVSYMESGNKPKADWRLGTEHEKFVFRKKDFGPVAYEGASGISALLGGLRDRYGWQAVLEGDNIIALTKNGASVTLEPAGQFELSGAMMENIHQTCDEIHTHLDQVKAIGDDLGIGFIGLGFHPTLLRSDAPVMPKARYGIMRAYMPKRGQLGLDMMLRTSTIQVNLDFSSEADMVKKFRTSLALQPVATALFANSPFTEGKPNGFKSMRSHVWTDTDPDRTGMLPFVFEDGFGFERYVDYLLDVPMYFVNRAKTINVAGQSFKDFMAGRLPGLPGEIPQLNDFIDHSTTAFPEVRLKTFLEMRGADGGPWAELCALPAFWVGLLYDDAALEAAWQLVRGWTEEERESLRINAACMGLDAPIKTKFGQSATMRDLARDVLDIAEQGLKARARLSSVGDNETGFLQVLKKRVICGKTPADVLLDAYHNNWNKSVLPIFDEFSY